MHLYIWAHFHNEVLLVNSAPPHAHKGPVNFITNGCCCGRRYCGYKGRIIIFSHPASLRMLSFDFILGFPYLIAKSTIIFHFLFFYLVSLLGFCKIKQRRLVRLFSPNFFVCVCCFRWSKGKYK